MKFNLAVFFAFFYFIKSFYFVNNNNKNFIIKLIVLILFLMPEIPRSSDFHSEYVQRLPGLWHAARSDTHALDPRIKSMSTSHRCLSVGHRPSSCLLASSGDCDCSRGNGAQVRCANEAECAQLDANNSLRPPKYPGSRVPVAVSRLPTGHRMPLCVSR